MGQTRTPELSDVTRHPGRDATAAWWRGAAIVGIALLVALTAADLFWLLVEPLTLVLVAIVIAQALSPLVAFVEERGLGHGVSVIAVYLVFVSLFGLLGWILVPMLITEGQALVSDLPAMVSQARSWVSSVIPRDGSSSNQLISWAETGVQRFSNQLLSLPITIFTSLLDFVVIVFMSAYWLIFTPSLRRFTLSLFPEEKRLWVDSVLDEMGATMGGFVRGTIIDGAIIAVAVYIGLTIIGLEYVLLLAVISGIGELVPIIGPIVAAVPAVVVGFLDSPQKAGIVLLFFLVLQQLESNLLLPLIMHNQADVPPLMSLVAVVIGGALGGILGAILAIPIFGALRILIVRVVAPAERDWTGVDDAPHEVGTEEETAPDEIVEEVDEEKENGHQDHSEARRTSRSKSR
ncbi:MAG TPA: AI-2E family transporter [Thermomicrobiales bacterium]|nr:AI-2E family transporter [Thermomicrobiales bacterium]